MQKDASLAKIPSNINPFIEVKKEAAPAPAKEKKPSPPKEPPPSFRRHKTYSPSPSLSRVDSSSSIMSDDLKKAASFPASPPLSRTSSASSLAADEIKKDTPSPPISQGEQKRLSTKMSEKRLFGSKRSSFSCKTASPPLPMVSQSPAVQTAASFQKSSEPLSPKEIKAQEQGGILHLHGRHFKPSSSGKGSAASSGQSTPLPPKEKPKHLRMRSQSAHDLSKNNPQPPLPKKES